MSFRVRAWIRHESQEEAVWRLFRQIQPHPRRRFILVFGGGGESFLENARQVLWINAQAEILNLQAGMAVFHKAFHDNVR